MPEPILNAPAETEAERIAATVKALREAYGLTPTQMAVALGVSVGRVYQIESASGGPPPKVDQLRRIADIFGVKLAAIVVKDYREICRKAEAADAKNAPKVAA